VQHCLNAAFSGMLSEFLETAFIHLTLSTEAPPRENAIFGPVIVAGRFCVVPESRETGPQTWNEGPITLFHQCQIFSLRLVLNSEQSFSRGAFHSGLWRVEKEVRVCGQGLFLPAWPSSIPKPCAECCGRCQSGRGHQVGLFHRVHLRETQDN
jgi:hypothetical protein